MVATLSKLSSLEVLDLGMSNIEDEQLIVLVDNLKNLQRLNLNSVYELTSKSLVCVVSELPRLKELCLDISCVDDGLLSLIVVKLPRLQRLELCSNLITKDGMRSISKLHHLTHLVIVLCYSITGLSMTCISSLNMLQTLDISDSRATDDVMWCISQLLKLRKLVMNSCENVTDVGILHISKLPLLEFLEISFSEITDVGLNHLSALNNLRSLICKSTYITSSAVQPFMERMYVEWSEATVHARN
jgi:Leucine-rich repeat (LRR) protein